MLIRIDKSENKLSIITGDRNNTVEAMIVGDMLTNPSVKILKTKEKVIKLDIKIEHIEPITIEVPLLKIRGSFRSDDINYVNPINGTNLEEDEFDCIYL